MFDVDRGAKGCIAIGHGLACHVLAVGHAKQMSSGNSTKCVLLERSVDGVRLRLLHRDSGAWDTTTEALHSNEPPGQWHCDVSLDWLRSLQAGGCLSHEEKAYIRIVLKDS